VQGGFIVGFDSDTPSIFQRQLEFIRESGIVTAMIGLLQAPAGTTLYKRLKQEGRLLGEMTGDNGDGSTNIIPKLEIGLLQDGYRRLVQDLYAPREYYQRVLTLLKNIEPPKIVRPLDRIYLRAFFRSVYQLGIKGAERAEYWKLLTWALIRKPKVLSQAITLAIYGHHFRTLAEQI
jgi:hypothetical protein